MGKGASWGKGHDKKNHAHKHAHNATENKLLTKEVEPYGTKHPTIHKPTAEEIAATIIQTQGRGHIARRRWEIFVHAGLSPGPPSCRQPPI